MDTILDAGGVDIGNEAAEIRGRKIRKGVPDVGTRVSVHRRLQNASVDEDIDAADTIGVSGPTGNRERTAGVVLRRQVLRPEELLDVDQARRNASQDELENELGDLLFVLVNLARFVKVDPEQALRKTNAKFRKRFGFIERKLAERGKKPADSNIEEMEALWQEAKR